MKNTQEEKTDAEEFTSKEILSYYENEAQEVPIFGSLREISLAENIMNLLPPSANTIIDIGCGEGYLLYRIQERHPKIKIFGLDLSEGRITTTKKHVPNAHLLRGNVLSLPFPDNSFDVVICSELLEHISAYKTVADELVRISKKCIIITVPNELTLVQVLCPKCKTKHFLDGHVNFFTEKKIKDIFVQNPKIEYKTLRKFHTIYTYNRLTMKFPLFVRLFLDKTLQKLEKKISFFKPNFLMLVVEKKTGENL